MTSDRNEDNNQKSCLLTTQSVFQQIDEQINVTANRHKSCSMQLDRSLNESYILNQIYMKALFLCNMDIYWKGRLIIQIKKAWNKEIVFNSPNNTIVKVWLV